MSILRTVEIFLRQTGMAPTRFGRDAVRDPRFVLDLRKGREPSERMCRRLSHFIATHGEGGGGGSAQGTAERQPGRHSAQGARA